MQIQISAKTEEQLKRLASTRGSESVEDVLADVVAAECERDAAFEPGLDAALDEGRSDVAAGRFEVLTRQLAASIASEGRERMAQREAADPR